MVINCITIDCHNTSKQLSYIKENLNLNFGQSENFILFSPVLFYPPSWIIVQSDDCFSICHLAFLTNQRQAAPPTPPPTGIELSLLHYWGGSTQPNNPTIAMSSVEVVGEIGYPYEVTISPFPFPLTRSGLAW